MYPVDRAGPRLRLRELHPDDVDAVFAVYGNAQATEHMSFEPRSREQVSQIIDRAVQSATADPRSEYALAVATQDDGDVIGFARLALDPHQPQGATIGFALRPDTWGVGHGLETVHQLLAFGFDDLGLHRIWGARSPLNTASARTLTAAGLVEEGVIREHVRKGDTWRDSVVHAILDHEWSKTPRTSTA
ncbi:GNAT family protein [Streptomyces sp. NPDC001904]|uniref:GNAT family N-acetyltransferase n=1 Tax=Streptomyces sp. NPDC001904 TaxID=3154531 RepID=UPI003321B499